MKTKRIRTTKDLPFEAGKTYTTKFQTREKFLINRIDDKDGVQIRAYGIYESHQHLGECPLVIERLVADTVTGFEIEVCAHCGK